MKNIVFKLDPLFLSKSNIKYPGKNFYMLSHQQKMRELLKKYDIVVNTYPTSAGKTLSAYLHILDYPDKNVLLIAPTNALLSQHKKDIEEFIQVNNLPHIVIEVNAALLRKLREELPWQYFTSNAKVLVYLMENPQVIKSLKQKYGDEKRPIILVVNPDIFYYSIYFSYDPSHKEDRNLFKDFLTKFDYIIIDEFHYYNAKQMGNFIFFIILSSYFGYFEVNNRKFAILSATPAPDFLLLLENLKKKRNVSHYILSPSKSENKDVKILSHIYVKILPLETENHSFSLSAELLKKYINKNLDVVIISNSLFNITTLYTFLYPHFKEIIGRITGPEDYRFRIKASSKKLILATPTVDIGFNFSRKKDRQNIDVIFFDAITPSQFIQRLGRAGRVLGKKVTNLPSLAIAFVPKKFYDKLLKSLQKDTNFIENMKKEDEEFYEYFPNSEEKIIEYNREDFYKIIKKVLPEKEIFTSFLESYGLYEAFYPIYKLAKAFFPNEENYKIREEIFSIVKECFTPDSEITFSRIKNVIQTYERRLRILECLENKDFSSKYFKFDVEKEFIPYAVNIAFEGLRKHGKPLSDILDELPKYYEEASIYVKEKKIPDDFFKKESFKIYIKNSIRRMDPLFSFRNSSNINLPALVYDPYTIFSSSSIANMDALYTISKCHCKLLDDNFIENLKQKYKEIKFLNFYMGIKILKLRTEPFHLILECDICEKKHESYFNRLILLSNLNIYLYGNNKFYESDELRNVNKKIRNMVFLGFLISKEDYNTYFYYQYEQTFSISSFPIIVNFNDIKDKKCRIYLEQNAIFMDSVRIKNIKDAKKRRLESALQFCTEIEKN